MCGQMDGGAQQHGVVFAPLYTGTGPCAGGPGCEGHIRMGPPRPFPARMQHSRCMAWVAGPTLKGGLAVVRCCHPRTWGQTAGPLPGPGLSFCAVPTPSLLLLGPSRSRPIARVQSLTLRRRVAKHH